MKTNWRLKRKRQFNKFLFLFCFLFFCKHHPIKNTAAFEDAAVFFCGATQRIDFSPKYNKTSKNAQPPFLRRLTIYDHPYLATKHHATATQRTPQPKQPKSASSILNASYSSTKVGAQKTVAPEPLMRVHALGAALRSRLNAF